MSHFNVLNDRLGWVTIPANGWMRLGDGCVQCGSRIDSESVLSLSGKCLNCRSRTSDEDEVLEDLQD